MNEEEYEKKMREIEERFKKYDAWTREMARPGKPTIESVSAMICQELLGVQKELMNIQKILSEKSPTCTS